MLNVGRDFAEHFFHVCNEYGVHHQHLGTLIDRVFCQTDPPVVHQLFEVVAHTHFRVLELQKELFEVDLLLLGVGLVEVNQYVVGNERSGDREILLGNFPDQGNQINDFY